MRRFPGSRRNPQFNQGPLAGALEQAGVAYRHAVELGGRRNDEPGEDGPRWWSGRSLELRGADGLLEWQEALAQPGSPSQRRASCARRATGRDATAA